VTVVQTVPVTKLAPGGAHIALAGTITNPNSAEVQINGITAKVGTLPTGCLAADFVIAGTVAPITVPANSTTTLWSGLDISLTSTSVNQDACKGLAVPLVFTVGTPAPIVVAPSISADISKMTFTSAPRIMHLVLAGQSPSTPVSVSCALVEKAPAGTATDASGALTIDIPVMTGFDAFTCQVSINTIVLGSYSNSNT
jgi:hypothetical protein